MKDIIFIVGASGVGKSTLAKHLFSHYKSVYLEQNMIPEFMTKDGVNDVTGTEEEDTCWSSMKALINNFLNEGFKNVLALDFNDIRCRDLYSEFEDRDYIIIKLVTSDYAQIKEQMLNRGDGLIDTDMQKTTSDKNNNRPLLLNEYIIDVAGKSPEQVRDIAINIIDNTDVIARGDYIPPARSSFYSWVWADNLK